MWWESFSENPAKGSDPKVWIQLPLLALLVFSTVGFLSAQTPKVPVTGVVTSEHGDSLSYATVSAKDELLGTTIQTTKTDIYGSFTLDKLIVNKRYSIKITRIGYEVYTLKNFTVKAGVNAPISIKLKQGGDTLSNVVVTALGIKKSKNSLGYSIQTIDGESVQANPSSNWINSLAGKVPGLNLNKVGGPMGSSDVVLRGDKVLALGASSALIVVDGIPVSSSFKGTGHGPYEGADNPIDFGSSLSDLNPYDIESISVLKGPAASALYGSRAASGAIIITTKTGSKLPGLNLYVTSSIKVDLINHWPDFQNDYGQGNPGSGYAYYSYGKTVDGASTSGTQSTFGPKFQGQSYFQFNSPLDSNGNKVRTPWKTYPHSRQDFFQTGVTTTNFISLSGQNVRASITYSKNDWIAPNTGSKRLTAFLSGSKEAYKGVTMGFRVNYNWKNAPNLPLMGYNNQTIMYALDAISPNIDINWFKNNQWLPNKVGIAENHIFSSNTDNMYIISYEMLNASVKHNVIGDVYVNAKLTRKLELDLRSGMDFIYEFRSQQRPWGTQKFISGMFTQQDVFSIESNSDFLLRYSDKVNSNITWNASFGGNSRNDNYKYTKNTAPRLALPNVYNLGNSLDPVVVATQNSSLMVNSLYAFLDVSYKNFLFGEATIREDWSSTLPQNRDHYIYPSVNGSLLLNNVLLLPSSITNTRLRLAYSQTGTGASSPYTFQSSYTVGAFPGSLQQPTTLANPNLKPQTNNAYEAGFTSHFFKQRASADITVYLDNTNNQIISLPIDYASGYTSTNINLGSVQNKGIELQLTGTPILYKNFRWSVIVNWFENRSKVTNITTPGSNGRIILYTAVTNTSIAATEGKPFGEIWGLDFNRSPDGQIIYDKSGNAVLGSSITRLGNISPKWKGGIINTFTYKSFQFSFILDTRQGGLMYSLTSAINNSTGKTKVTIPGRYDGILGKGVQQNADGTFSANTVKATDVGNYYATYYQRYNTFSNLYSASYIKLREVTISYNLPKKAIHKIAAQEISVGIFGRDLFCWSKFPGYDPEISSLASSTVIPGLELQQFPSTRSMGLNIKARF